MEHGKRAWGATRRPDGAWDIATWAPSAEGVALVLDEARHSMERDAEGWHHIRVEAAPGARYGFEIGGRVFPDPASRRQDGGVAARSVLVDPGALIHHATWTGRDWAEAVILELHVGTFTAQGTLRAAAERLHGLADLGITAIGLMPLAQFEGERGWGYDGVLPYAIHPAYGTPDDMAAFVRIAHEAGLMVLIDAVYNHFGPEGDVLGQVCPEFFDAERHTPWGAAIDFDRPEVQDFFIGNAEMWLRDYRADGLRLDAVHQIGRAEDTWFLTRMAERLAPLEEKGRRIHLVTEDERNLASYVSGDHPIRAQWNDDWHHAIHCLLTGESASYYRPFSVDPFGDLVTAMRDGQVDQGQPRPHQDTPRGEPSGHLPPDHFVNANQTHDQVGNRAMGERLVALTDPATAQVVHAMLLCAPFIPMLFMGEEVGARAPFQFFTDFHGDLADAVRQGRRSEFPEFADARDEIPDPNARQTFADSRPYARAAEDAEDWRALTRHCLGLRHEHVIPLLSSGWHGTEVDRLSDRSLRARWRFADGTLEIAFTMEGEPPSGSDDMREIYYHKAETGAGLRVGIGDPQ
ncbi:malto-oligosyltrehalose trehalohydrolase [Palleronia sediminis]|uniref:Malto-oligosyltrehalose trehalohydrolase n=1 Tax=Palleronia sediminis TaxID=2547833 RepID=A0A4R6ADR4_9RHOB|nr:malto-oligosyltrehalose trehalohydrolase [Palleronia sediminis]TDL81347.1 malto-oligosyltrehalose trehalohydrolase [Palleronia sediminis]